MKNYSFLLTSAATPAAHASEGEKSRGASRIFMQFIVRQAYNAPAIKNNSRTASRRKMEISELNLHPVWRTVARTYRPKLFQNQQYSAAARREEG